MTYRQKNILVTLGSYFLILIYFLIRIFSIIQTKGLDAQSIYRLWGITIILTIVLTIINTILFHIASAFVQAVQTGGEEEPDIDSLEDERDYNIKLKGTRIAYIVFSIGVLIAMGTMVIGQPPLVMFSIIILTNILAEIVSDIAQLIFYNQGT